MSRRTEWREQVKLARLLEARLDRSCTWWTATEGVAGSRTSGAVRRMRGVRAGTPDMLCLYRGQLIGVEMKSPAGVASAAQKAVRDEMLRAGGQWWLARTARAAMMALQLSGVQFRRRWKPPRLAPWEGPWRDPTVRLPQHPEVAKSRRASQKRWRERRKAARMAGAEAVAEMPAAGRDGAGVTA